MNKHYLTRDVEDHRKLYDEKAAHFLRIELTSPTETEKIIEKQQKEIEELKTTLCKIQPLIDFANGFQEKELQSFLTRLKEAELLITEIK